ncbi:MAG: PEP-CTERM sorting domain-containing protein [Gemmatimonadaceae bacterium]|jgi:hypothetical protein|nr:PEP-CTERM sorting domain-containing protein [Gemmatimonadaceae bacterium]
MHVRLSPLLAAVAGALVLFAPVGAAAQTNSFRACTQGVLRNCADLEFRVSSGGGADFFEVLVRNLGSSTTPSLATSIYNLVFTTGAPPVDPANTIAESVAPIAEGGATVTDATPWDLLETGDFLFLNALGNNGVGGCVASGPVGGFGQAGTTCAAGEFLAFRFFTPRSFDPALFTLTNLEVVGLESGLPADTCSEDRPCTITPLGAVDVPEPASVSLVAFALAMAGAAARRRRRTTRSPMES